MKGYRTKRIGLFFLILTGIDIIVSVFLQNILIPGTYNSIKFWIMIFPWITTLLFAVWFLTASMHHDHPRRALAIRIVYTYFWICGIIVGVISIFYPF